MMSLWDALRMNMMISYQELVRTFLSLPTFFVRPFVTQTNQINDGKKGIWSTYTTKKSIISRYNLQHKTVSGR
ncbi:hypothetical protein DYZ94_24500 [Klebsiella variicola]|nr:hypothetical protein CYD38_24155 [Klebsiella variicola]REI44623.1 hypothetical protein DYB09_21730 [Klebsiella variicola]REI45883.1 hypothetical protein DY002_24725 [Klebsiella variicola]REI52407.1 hypothetical protein DYB19_16305 [Klebsiella variicola]REI59951.1 hypothetical protein DY007_24570 [Klebsiella variicola]